MEGFEWAEHNLRVESPRKLQDEGRVNVFWAPMISPDTKVVNLANGRVEQFIDDEERPKQGYYAEWDSLERYCRRHEIPLTETEGFVSVMPWGEEAGDPLEHGFED